MKHVVVVRQPRELKTFIDFPHELYKEDKNYVPELYIAQKDLLTPGKHPFHEHSTVQLFLAYEGKKLIGRIAAIVNNNHNKYYNAKDGFFGFFDTINDKETAHLLFNTATEWLRAKGLQTIIGPVNFSTNETCGLLVEGFEYAPLAMMPYNASYYLPLIESAGFSKKTDLLAYRFFLNDYNDAHLKRLSGVLQERLKKRNILIRSINLKNFKQEVNQIREVYNAAWNKNLGFVPMTEHEFNYLAKDLKLILDKDFCIVAEQEGKVVGFALAIPNINEILIHIKKGRLLPAGIFKLLLNRKKIKGLRIITLGVIEGYRRLGIEAFFYSTIIQKVFEKNIKFVDASWILEDNIKMNQAILNIKGQPYKRYRIFEKQI